MTIGWVSQFFFVVFRDLLPLAVPQTTETRPVRIFGAHGTEATAGCRLSDDCKFAVETRVADSFASHQTGIRADGSGYFRTEHTGDSDFRGHASSAATLHQYICWCLHNQNRRWYNWDWCCDLSNNYCAIVSPTKVTVCGEIVVAHENLCMTNISKESTGFVDISEKVATKSVLVLLLVWLLLALLLHSLVEIPVPLLISTSRKIRPIREWLWNWASE